VDETVNLYYVHQENAEYGLFVFASTHNKAKSLCVNHFTDDEPYIDMRARIMVKNVGGTSNIVVDSDMDDAYKRVLAVGCGFINEEED
jgi:hypothetical protein